jgi:hypothetical protein
MAVPCLPYPGVNLRSDSCRFGSQGFWWVYPCSAFGVRSVVPTAFQRSSGPPAPASRGRWLAVQRAGTECRPRAGTLRRTPLLVRVFAAPPVADHRSGELACQRHHGANQAPRPNPSIRAPIPDVSSASFLRFMVLSPSPLWLALAEPRCRLEQSMVAPRDRRRSPSGDPRADSPLSCQRPLLRGQAAE